MLVDCLPESHSSYNAIGSTQSSLDTNGNKGTDVRICFELRMINGLHLFQKNLSCSGLVHLIEKLEVLC